MATDYIGLTMADLEARQRGLAYDVVNDVPGALADLEAVERAISHATRQARIRDLAEQEAKRRGDEAERERRRRERLAALARLEELQAQADAQQRGLFDAVLAIKPLLEEYDRTVKEQYRIGLLLGQNVRLNHRDVFADFCYRHLGVGEHVGPSGRKRLDSIQEHHYGEGTDDAK
jgi:hypothetical protein